MKTLKFLFVAILCVGLFFTQNEASGQATKTIEVEYSYDWDCLCTGEYMFGTLTSVGIINANGEHWRTTGTAIGEDTGNVYEISNVENYEFKLRNNGSYKPDKGVWTMQIRLNGKTVALTHPSYEIIYDSNGEFKEIIWGGFWCSPN